MMPTLSRVMVVAAVLTLGVSTAAARGGGGHGGGGSGGGHSGGHSMSGGHGDHEGHHGDRGGDHDRDDGLGHGDDPANTGPCGMGWGWTDGRYCDEPSLRIGGDAEATQKAEAPAKP
jgi:hypothetical protein